MDRKDRGPRGPTSCSQWVFLTGTDVNVTQFEDGASRRTGPKPKRSSGRSSPRAAARLLRHDAARRRRQARRDLVRVPRADRVRRGLRDLLGILVNQATVSLRNAQLYQQVPLVGFLKPLPRSAGSSRDPASGGCAGRRPSLAALVLLFVVPWRFRVGGPGGSCPARRARDGPRRRHRRVGPPPRGRPLEAGEVIATLKDGRYRASLAEARAALRKRREGALPAPRSGRRRRHVRRALALGRAGGPDRDGRGGRLAGRGSEPARRRDRHAAARGACRPGARPGRRVLRRGRRGPVTVEVAVPEADAAAGQAGTAGRREAESLIRPGRFGERSRASERGCARRARSASSSPRSGSPTPKASCAGNAGRGKVRVGHRSIAHLLLRKPARWISASSGLCFRDRRPSAPAVARRGSREAAAALAARRGRSERPPCGTTLVIRRIVRMGEVSGSSRTPNATRTTPSATPSGARSSSSTGRGPAAEMAEEYNRRHPGAGVDAGFILEYQEMLRGINLLEQSSAERSLELLAQVEAARKRAAEAKAEGFNPFFIQFKVLDPNRFLDRTVRYVRWIWSPPVVVFWVAAVALDDRSLRPELGTDLDRHLRALRVFEQAPRRRPPVLRDPLPDRRNPRIRACLRDEDLRRRGPRHRARAPLFHAGVLLRHHRLDPLREQVAQALDDDRRDLHRGVHLRRGDRALGRDLPGHDLARARVQDDALHRRLDDLLQHQPPHQDRRLLRPDERAGDPGAARRVAPLHRRLDPEADPAPSGRRSGRDPPEAADLLDLRNAGAGLPGRHHAVHRRPLLQSLRPLLPRPGDRPSPADASTRSSKSACASSRARRSSSTSTRRS